MFADIIL
ncbi:hypothetical protein LSH36_414g03039 [Paralvinella palmiformis]|nr:hypothetical protein LSH36_414g03039 [Paralvinella palmiformis]